VAGAHSSLQDHDDLVMIHSSYTTDFAMFELSDSCEYSAAWLIAVEFTVL